jgi:hypothetical protein
MITKLQNALEDMFKYQCFTISETGKCSTICFIIKDYDMVPVLLNKGVEMDAKDYITFSLNFAHKHDADSIILIGEQYMVSGDIDSESLKLLLSGKMTASEHPDRKANLVLTYMKADGETHMLFGEIKNLSGTRYVTDQKWSHNTKTSVLVPWR